MLFFSISNKFIKKLSKKKRVSQKLFLIDDILRHPLFSRALKLFFYLLNNTDINRLGLIRLAAFILQDQIDLS